MAQNEAVQELGMGKYQKSWLEKKLKHFNKEKFIEDIVEYSLKKCFVLMKEAIGRNSLYATCNLYTIITLEALRDFVGYECEYAVLDEYRDEILEELERQLVGAGFKTFSTYKYDPYMVATITVCCNNEVKQSELAAIGLGYTELNEMRNSLIVVLAAVVGAFLLKMLMPTIIYAFDLVTIPFFKEGWCLFVVYLLPILTAIGMCIYYFRRCISAFFAEKCVRFRLWNNRRKMVV